MVGQTPEVPREIIRETGEPELFRRGNNTLGKQFLIMSRQIVVELGTPRPPVLLCDRTLLDHWCYTLALFPEFDDPVTRRIWDDFVAEYLKTYDLVFYLPSEFPPANDGVREGDLQFQRDIDEMIRAKLASGNPTGVIEVRGTLDGRVEQCNLHIERLLNGEE